MKRIPKSRLATALGVWLTCFAPDATAQFGRTFASPDFVPPTVNGTYSPAPGPLAVLLETSPASDEAHLFVDRDSGRTLSSFRLDPNHRAFPSPDATEVLVAGTTSFDTDPGPATILQPVYFAGRYQAGTLAPIEERQIGVDRNSGYNLTGQLGPDGAFVFSGTHAGLQANVVLRYSRDLLPAAGCAITYQGGHAILGLSVFPLANGTLGFHLPFPGTPDATGTAHNTHVLGLLDSNGSLRWNVSLRVTNSPTFQDSLHFVFGRDGSCFGSLKSLDLLAPVTDAVRVWRITPTGTIAYSHRLRVPGASLEWQYYLGGSALLYATFKESGADRIQLIALDPQGQLTRATALKAQLRGSGLIKLTAARRDGTDFAFLRLECAPPGQSPQQTLARWHLATGALDLRRLPSPVPGGETYEIVTTPKGNAPGSNLAFPALEAVSATVVGIRNQTGGGGHVGLYELPPTGAFPECLPLTPSAVTEGAAIPVVLSDGHPLDTTVPVTVIPHAPPGMVPPLTRPSLLATTLVEATLCPDDAGPPATSLSLVRTGPSTAELQVPTTPGFRYTLEQSSLSGPWTDLAQRVGDGALWTREITLDGNAAFYRCRIEPE
jgi:hypothetical protein